jgi:hypothetical protein
VVGNSATAHVPRAGVGSTTITIDLDVRTPN